MRASAPTRQARDSCVRSACWPITCATTQTGSPNRSSARAAGICGPRHWRCNTCSVVAASGCHPASGGGVRGVRGRHAGISASRLPCRRFWPASHAPPTSFRPITATASGCWRSMVEPTESWALDIQGSKTVLSFGAPLLEGWGTSGRLVTQFLGSDRKTRLIQAEPNGSLTARAADVWLPIKPGSEAALALGLANLLIEKKLYDPSVVCPDLAPDSAYRSLLREFPPERVAEITGIAPGAVVETAQSLAEGGPALVVSRGCVTGSASLAEERAIQALNLLLGNLDQPGGVIARRNTVPEARPVPTTTTPGRQTAGILRSLAAVPDGSVDLLIVDASFSSPPFAWGAIERKLQPGKSMVVVLASLPNAWTSHADVVIPAPVFGETIDEVREGFDSPEESFSLSARLTEPLPGLFRLHDFVALLATSAGLGAQAGSSQEVIRQKILAIHQAGKGTVFSPAEGQAKPISEFASSDDLFKALTEGARWEGELPEPKKPAATALLALRGRSRGSGADARGCQPKRWIGRLRSLRLSPGGPSLRFPGLRQQRLSAVGEDHLGVGLTSHSPSVYQSSHSRGKRCRERRYCRPANTARKNQFAVRPVRGCHARRGPACGSRPMRTSWSWQQDQTGLLA